ncbi:DMT family transporter [Maritalea myrionectae]|uniref:DMT family transporter n=1 Tax=Maritalea myrionectae TaxID=454601 RepID=UPI0003FC1480|nr:DMT family transporter [Maritalea myrionectae]
MPTGWLIGGLMVAAILGGALIAAQGPIYARMAVGLGNPIIATLIAFLIATCAISLVAILTRVPMPDVQAVRTMPPWVWLGALIGVYQVLVSIFAVPRLGVAPFILVVIVGQICASLLYDHFGLFDHKIRPVNVQAMLGATLVFIGALLVIWR